MPTQMLTVAAPAKSVQEFAEDVRWGLSQPGQKRLSCKYLYDSLGSTLFEAICLLPEYGLTRAEERIFTAHANEIASAIPCPTSVVELGSGTGKKNTSHPGSAAPQRPINYPLPPDRHFGGRA